MHFTKSDKKWFVLLTRPRAEKQISMRLTEINVENYLPLRRELRKWNDRKKWIETPLFSSYIFVKIEELKRAKVFEAQGVVKFISNLGVPVSVSEQEIERIRKICSYIGEVNISREKLGVGDVVEIVGGHFSGTKAELVGFERNNKLRLSIPSLGCFAYIEIEKESVLKVLQE